MAEDFSGLFTALFSCFLIIILGYITGRLKLITPSQNNGIGNFIAKFAFPALLFKSMVELNFETVSWTFILAIALAKAVVFFTVLILTLLVLRQRGLAQAALYAIFTTQSNDFAIGYPIVKVLYGKNHPELLQYIYLLAPISLLMLNPIGFAILEVNKQWKINEKDTSVTNGTTETELTTATPCDNCPLAGSCSNANDNVKLSEDFKPKHEKTYQKVWKIVKGFLSNLIVLMVLVGLAFHFIFKGKVPGLLQPFLTTLGNAFDGTALFYLGLSMVGKISQQKGVKLLLPSTLIIAKILVLPILAHTFFLVLSNVLPIMPPNHGMEGDVISSNYTSFGNMSYKAILANYAFLYGTFPTAPTVVVYAGQYNLDIDLLATGMVACTTLSAPIMYISAWMLTIQAMDYSYYEIVVESINQDVSIVGVICSVWCIAVFLISRKAQRMPHLVTLLLCVSLFISSLTVVIGCFSNTFDGPLNINKYVAYAFLFFGAAAARLYTAALAICLVVIHFCGDEKAWTYRLCFSAIPAVCAAMVAIILTVFGHPVDDQYHNNLFLFGNEQSIAFFVVILASLIMTILCLLCLVRLPNLFNSSTQNMEEYNRLGTTSETSLSEIRSTSSDWNSISNDAPKVTPGIKWCAYFPGSHQTGRHIALLVLLCLSELIALAALGWRISGAKLSGIYFELAFLDAVFNFGQAFFVFLLFGLDDELIVEPLMALWQQIKTGDNTIPLIPLEDVGQDVLKRCSVFVKHHLEHCKRDLLHSERSGIRNYSNVLRGSDLCSWLVDVGLASDRNEAVIYGQDLMMGRLLKHVSDKQFFYDSQYLYEFEMPIQQNSVTTLEDSTSCDHGQCIMQPKLYTFQRFLRVHDDFIATSSVEMQKDSKHKRLEHNPKEKQSLLTTNGEPSTSQNILSNVAQSTANMILSDNDELLPQTTRAVVHSRQELLDW
ncbi:lysosomal cholesterol signaling protein-like isoform X2 [Clavelina lepadiformis]|uniref:DEP domain-containing protein n=1 Tax=Clavelina lepadiformis TaxID=159417 RepID=A0ABP0H4N7_CLALP